MRHAYHMGYALEKRFTTLPFKHCGNLVKENEYVYRVERHKP